MFDKDGGGSIDPSELREIVRGLFCLAGIKVPDEILDNRCQVTLIELQTKVCEDFTITEKAPSITRRPSRGLLRDCENFADGSFSALTNIHLVGDDGCHRCGW